MEKPWYPQRNTIDAPVALIKTFIYSIGIRISRQTIEEDLKSHTEFPLLSFDALSQILEKWGLKSVSYKISADELKDLPIPSILFINDERAGIKMGLFVMFNGIKDKKVEYLHTAKGWVREDLGLFDKKWVKAGLSLTEALNPAGEPDFEEKEKRYNNQKNSDPNLKILKIKNDFLTNAECDYIIALSNDKFKKSKVMSEVSNIIEERSSYSAELVYPEDKILNQIKQKASAFLSMPPSHFEFFQCVSYETGQEFQNHFDTFDENTEIGKSAIRKGGQRKYTMLVYLNDDFEGGSTYFPYLDILIQPKKGRVVVFDNLDENGKVRKSAFHAGLPVTNGKKYAMNIWVRDKPLMF